MCVAAARQNKVVDVRAIGVAVCSRGGERQELSNAADVHSQTDSVGAVGRYGYTALHQAASNNRLESSSGDGRPSCFWEPKRASADAKNDVRAGCSCLGAHC